MIIAAQTALRNRGHGGDREFEFVDTPRSLQTLLSIWTRSEFGWTQNHCAAGYELIKFARQMGWHSVGDFHQARVGRLFHYSTRAFPSG